MTRDEVKAVLELIKSSLLADRGNIELVNEGASQIKEVIAV